MSRKKKKPDGGPSNGYLMSFGDTMTALLAFFIVLNSLAEEQTGANLHAGTGSFISTVKSMGLPGNLSTGHSSRPAQLKEPSPFYQVETEDGEESNSLRVIDREREVFQRLLNEMERFYEINELPATRGSVVFDVFQKLEKSPKPISRNSRKLLNRVRPLLQRSGYEVEVVVWATTPGRSAWLRAFRQAKEIKAQFVKERRLSPRQAARLRPVARPWLFSDEKRPVMSVAVITHEMPSE